MLVIAKQVGEHPQGVWRNPGDEFNFEGKKIGLWMEKAKGKSKKDDSSAEEKAAEAAKAIEEANAKKAEDKAAEDLAKETAAKLAAEAGKKDDDADPAFKAIHRGAGKWDVFDSELKVVEGGDNLDKAGAAALVEKLLAEAQVPAE